MSWLMETLTLHRNNTEGFISSDWLRIRTPFRAAFTKQTAACNDVINASWRSKAIVIDKTWTGGGKETSNDLSNFNLQTYQTVKPERVGLINRK